MPRNYVDNAYNRSLGRVGMPVGSMPVSRGATGSGGGGGGSGVSFYSSGIGSSSFGGSSPAVPKTYVDNAYNRSLGRVGLEHGTAVVSRSDRTSHAGITSGDSLFYQTEPKTYVDNAYNRRLGRVGMEHGTAVVSRLDKSRSSTKSFDDFSQTSEKKTYVDNAYNRRVGRVGMEHGTAVVSRVDKSSSSTKSFDDFSKTSEKKTYVDNAYNRRLDRVGKEHGTAVVSKYDKQQDVLNKQRVQSTKTRATTDCNIKDGQEGRVYTDNALNRRLDRVGKPIGTAVYNKKTGEVTTKMYKDTYQNRALDRVGKPRGSQPVPFTTKGKPKGSHPVSSTSEETIQDNWQSMYLPHLYPFEDYYEDPVSKMAQWHLNRQQEEIDWMADNDGFRNPTAGKSLISSYSGTIIPYSELEIGKKIGEGAFGEVFFGKWHGSVVAVKRLRSQRISKKRLQDFSEEVLNFCRLDHPNIVQFIGACVERPNLCIVMEYMQTSLFDSLHIEEVNFTEEERKFIICDMCSGLQYLHEMKTAHCDLKSTNILLNFNEDDTIVAKITDFGLSMVKADTETSRTTDDETVQYAGTPRYSAPEVLRGELLTASDMMKADIYSIALVVFEVIYEEEPFYDLTDAQLRKQIGVKGRVLDLSSNINVAPEIKAMLWKACCFKADNRPTIDEFMDIFTNADCIYFPQ